MTTYLLVQILAENIGILKETCFIRPFQCRCREIDILHTKLYGKSLTPFEIVDERPAIINSQQSDI